ncbi:MAG: hypothetical protein A2003_02925 [Acinetobacter sp. GWC1_38_13]|uniref:glycosyltransferase n=1 Tax=Acinetobacter TaxID=469 RepID=UPI0008B41CBB|nr:MULTISPECIES: glycosyltransferase [Acinetobacter]MDH0666472.1 glycosyltransferase [Acinetobacter junii]OFW47655.1 MAG: hypothetical protein A2003_02925 [Acinetobacter sp. GWC1_38_13]HAV57728.1 hypothetical protein [Acinetobacter junii]
MKKILFIQDALYGGGVERITIDIAKKFIDLGYKVSYAILDSSNIGMQLPKEVKQINIDVDSYFMSGNLWRNKNKILDKNKQEEIQNIIKTMNPDLLLIGHYRSLWLSTFIEHPNTWYWIHGDIIHLEEKQTNNLFRYIKEKRRIYIERKIFNNLFHNKNILVVNHDIKNTYKKYNPNIKIKCIPNGIDINRLISSIPDITEKIWDTIFVGRLSKEKQPEISLIAFAKSGLNGRMAFVGDGDLLESLKQLAHTLNIENRIDFLGWKENPAAYIKQSKTLILSSLTEGSPLVIAESISLNVPVIAFNCSSGIRYQLNSMELQKGLVEPQNIEKLAQKLFEITHSPYQITEEDKLRLTIDHMFNEFLNIL